MKFNRRYFLISGLSFIGTFLLGFFYFDKNKQLSKKDHLNKILESLGVDIDIKNKNYSNNEFSSNENIKIIKGWIFTEKELMNLN